MMFADTLNANTLSRRQNEHSQVFGTSCGWARAHGLKTNSKAHKALSILAKRDGVPDTMVVDRSKEQTLGEFRKKHGKMDVCVQQMEPSSQWESAAEGQTRELKQGSAQKMTSTNTPKRFWDDCLETEGCVQSHTVLDICQLNGEVSETVMKGCTADIFPCAEHGWCQWAFWTDPIAQFPNCKTRLG